MVKGIVDLNVDDIEVYFDGKKVNDLPLEKGPLPDAKDKEWLAKNVRPVQSTDDLTNLTDLSYLKAVIGDAKVIGLGESTHGTKEYFTLRHRIIKLLVEQMGFTVIAFENDMTATGQVLNPECDTFSSQKLLNTFFGRVHQTEEMAALFDYVRTNNKLGKTKVYIEGVDNQSMATVLMYMQNYLPKVDTTLASFLPKINWQRFWRDRSRQGYMDTVFSMCSELGKQFTIRKAAIAAKLGSADSIMRLEKYISLLGSAIAFELNDKKQQSGINLRDSLMANNALWLLKRYPGQKIILWCHNTHVQKDVLPDEEQPFYAVGYHLKRKLGKDYKSFGFLTGNGTATFYNTNGQPAVKELEKPTVDSYEYYLASLNKPVLYWPMPVAEKEIKAHSVMLNRLKRRSNGFYFVTDQFRNYELAKQFDGVFFISNTNYARSFFLPKQ